jgi:4-hydroxy-2-oxoheptanedioate aldolase
MAMRPNPVKQRLRQGQASVGTWLSLGSVTAAELLVSSGFEWLTVDAEHSPLSWETVAHMVGVIAHAGGVPLVRVPWNSGENIKRALDLGAYGVVVPMVNSVAEAEAAVRAAKYPPAGTRSVGGILRSLRFATDPGTYRARADEEILVVIQAEHRDHLERAHEIARVPGIDAVFIGPHDLGASLGLPPDAEAMEPHFATVLNACRAAGVAAGIHAPDGAAARRRLEQGFRFVAAGSDAGMLDRLARAEARRARGEAPAEARGGGEVME